jgi:hypothetical protein
MLNAQDIIDKALKKLRDTNMTALEREIDYVECCNQASRRLALALKSEHKRHRARLADGEPYYELPDDFVAMYGAHIWFEDRNEDAPLSPVRKRVCEVKYSEVRDNPDLETAIGRPKVFYINHGGINLYPAPAVEQEEFTYYGKDTDGTIIDGLPVVYFDNNVIQGTYPENTQVVYQSRNSDDRDIQEIYFDYYNYAVVADESSELALPKILELPLVYLTASVICEENDDVEGQIKMTNMFSGALHNATAGGRSAANNDDSRITGVEFFGG